MRITIRTRILSIFVGVALIQVLLIGAFFLYQHNKSRHNLVSQQLHTVSESLNAQVSIFLNTILHDLETASQQVERMAQKDYQQYNLLKTLKNNNTAFSALAFYDINGNIKSAVSSDEKQNIPDCFTNNSALFDLPYYSGIPYVSQLTLDNNTLTIAISQPVHFLNNSYIIGVISALVPYETLQQIVDKAIFPPALDILVLNSNGRVLAQIPQNGTTNTSFPAEQQWDGEIVIDNVHYISVSSHLEFYDLNLTIVAKIDTRNSLAPSTGSFLLLSFWLLLLLLLSAFVGWTTNKKIVVPLQLLANESTTMLNGKEVDLTAPTDAELQDLAKALSTMNQQLQASNISLEKEVKRRRSEEKTAILAKIDAEKANQAKSIFLANMSHEIRTPLHGMIGMLEMLEKDFLNQDQKHLLSMSIHSGQRLHTVVNSILDLSQIESGKFQLPYSPFPLSKLVTEVVELMQIQTHDKNIRITSKQAADIPDALIGNSGRIRQILINLINNSIKFSEQGSIDLEIHLQSTPSEEEVQLLFSVKDEGNGISDDARHTIFDAFDRGDTEHENIVEGTGLGLAISSEFAQLMGGKLWLASSDKSGSTFCFTIVCGVAVENAPKSEKKEVTLPIKKLTGIRVFLAEDEFINQRIIAAYLEEQGCIVTVCANGQELLGVMEKEVADLILMDIRMPVLNGLETTRIIREMEKDADHPPIPIVALTAQATKDFEVKCKTAGMNNYLTKPIPLDKLVTIIYDLVKKKQV